MTTEELWEALTDYFKAGNERFAVIDTQVDALEVQGDQVWASIRDNAATCTLRARGWREVSKILSERLDTLSARIDLVQPRQPNMVECPACRDGLVSSTGDADDPPSHDRCELCGGAGEVPQGVAAHVGKLERRLRVLGLQGRGRQESAIYWRERYDKEVTHREEDDPQEAVVDASSEGGPGAGMGESMGREG